MRLRALRARLNGRAAPIEQHPRNSTGEDKA
jgi:hypothetical protein